VLLERGQRVGGLMQSIKRGDYVVDIGRKQMYSRIPEIHDLWSSVLGDDYIPYERRVGILYQGTIIESSRQYRGALLGMPKSLLLSCGVDFLWGWARRGMATPKNQEEYWYRRRGQKLSRILTQGFEERFRGEMWRDQPAPDDPAAGFLAAIASKFRTAASMGGEDEPGWRHPALGTGQIVEALEKDIQENGGHFEFGTNVTSMQVEDGRVVSIQASQDGQAIEYRPKHVVGAVPVELLAKLLNARSPATRVPAAEDKRRSTVLVYLFLDCPPPFPHTFLEVSCPNMKCGRIANYASMGGRMVPEGKTALCVEFFLDADDPLMERTAEELGDLAVTECTKAGILDPKTIEDRLPLKFAGADAATDYRDWLTDERRAILGQLEAYSNLYFVNRAGTDVASYAGAEAARAIASGERTTFDRATDPRHSEEDPEERLPAERPRRADSAA